jgi:hypothetical protein
MVSYFVFGIHIHIRNVIVPETVSKYVYDDVRMVLSADGRRDVRIQFEMQRILGVCEFHGSRPGFLKCRILSRNDIFGIWICISIILCWKGQQELLLVLK